MIEAKRFQEYPPVNSSLVPQEPRVEYREHVYTGQMPWASVSAGNIVEVRVNPFLIHRRIFYGRIWQYDTVFGAFDADATTLTLTLWNDGAEIQTFNLKTARWPYYWKEVQAASSPGPEAIEITAPSEAIIAPLSITDSDAVTRYYQLVMPPRSMTARIDRVSLDFTRISGATNYTNGHIYHLGVLSQNWPF